LVFVGSNQGPPHPKLQGKAEQSPSDRPSYPNPKSSINVLESNTQPANDYAKAVELLVSLYHLQQPKFEQGFLLKDVNGIGWKQS
jgi:hypothetical protein